MKLLIKIPTRQRKEKFFKLLDTCINRLSPDADYHILVSCDDDDAIMVAEASRLDTYKNLSYFYSKRDTKIGACNRDMDKIDDDWDVVVLISDDMLPMVDNWDKYITAGMERYFPDTDGALWFYDGHKDDLNTVAILGNTYYKRTGYIYYPEYKSTWCDNDYQMIAEMLGKIKKCDWPMVLFEHVRKDITIDNVHIENRGHGTADKSTFMRRKEELYGTI